mgnify:CR=1 FL=1
MKKKQFFLAMRKKNSVTHVLSWNLRMKIRGNYDKGNQSSTGYQGKWEKEIHLTEDGQILELEAENEPVQLSPQDRSQLLKRSLNQKLPGRMEILRFLL